MLPAYANKGQLPGQVILDLPADLINKGALRVSIRKEAGANTVLSEIWLELASQHAKAN